MSTSLTNCSGEKPARVRVQPLDSVDEAVVMGPSSLSSLSPAARQQTFHRMLPLIARVRKFRFGGDCLQHVVVCRGLAHLAIDPVMHPWDIAALVPCVEESGGVVATMDGRRENVVFGESLLSCCSEALLRQVLDVVRYPSSLVREDARSNGERTTDT